MQKNSKKPSPRKKGYTHGTRTKYLFDKCRCEPCRKANSEYKNPYTRKYRKAGKDNARIHQYEKQKEVWRQWSVEKKNYDFLP